MSGPFGADGVDDLDEQAGAVEEAAAVFVGALVGERRKELMEEIAVGGVDLNQVEACLQSSARGQAKGVDGGVDAGLIERLGHGVGG